MTTNGDKAPLKISDRVVTTFREPVVKEILRSQLDSIKTKISDEAVELITELARIITVEAALRAARLASAQGSKSVKMDHAENVLPQIMLDFP